MPSQACGLKFRVWGLVSSASEEPHFWEFPEGEVVLTSKQFHPHTPNTRGYRGDICRDIEDLGFKAPSPHLL